MKWISPRILISIMFRVEATLNDTSNSLKVAEGTIVAEAVEVIFLTTDSMSSLCPDWTCSA